MEFAINKADLVRELNLSQGVVEKKTTIPILSNVLIEAEGDRIVLTATDLELGVRCSAVAKVKKGGSGTIPAKKLLDYVRLLPDGEINIKFADNQWATITCGRSKTRIAGMSRESFPELPNLPEVLAEIPVKTLAQMISKTIFAISAEESRFTLNGALLIVRADGMVMVSTDSHRLALVEQKVPLGNLKAPYRALRNEVFWGGPALRSCGHVHRGQVGYAGLPDACSAGRRRVISMALFVSGSLLRRSISLPRVR